MKIAIPVWEGKVSPVFDTACRLLVLQVKNRKETSRFETFLDERELTRRCLRIQALGLDTLICGAISKHFYRMLVSDKIEIIPWISGPAEEVLEAYLNGELFNPRFLMPGSDWHKKKPGTGNTATKRDKGIEKP